MFRDVVLQDTRPEDWPEIRQHISARVSAAMGTAPEVQVEPHYEVVEEYERYGLTHRKFRFSVMPDEEATAVMVLPDGLDERSPAPALVVCHGTDAKLGKYNVLDPVERPKRAYAVELAQRGFVTVAPDSYMFGERLTQGEDLPDEEIQRRYVGSMKRFREEHPEWSLDGRRNWEHQRLLDLLDGFDFVRPRAYGVIGNSLGGRQAIFLAAMDERIAAAVPSCGISPNLTNVYRSAHISNPVWIKRFQRTRGHMLYDYQDMIALCAPRPLLVLEPYNDAHNPYIEANFRCYVAGQLAYELLGKADCFCTLTHGDGHDTVEDVREFAYRWFERWLEP